MIACFTRATCSRPQTGSRVCSFYAKLSSCSVRSRLLFFQQTRESNLNFLI